MNYFKLIPRIERYTLLQKKINKITMQRKNVDLCNDLFLGHSFYVSFKFKCKVTHLKLGFNRMVS